MNTSLPFTVRVISGACLSAFLGLSSAVQAQVLVNDTFADGGRTNGADAADIAFFSVGSPTTFAVQNDAVSGSNALRYTNGGFAQFVGFFNATTLSVGSSIKLSFDIRAVGTTSNVSNAFRFGFFNSQGTQQVDDNAGSSPTFNGRVGDAGYFVGINPTAIAGGIASFSETDTSGFTLGGSEIAGINTGTSIALNSGYTNVALSLTRASATSMVLTFIYNGGAPISIGTQSGTLTATTFDAIYLGSGSSTGGLQDVYIDNITVSAIPEPSTYAAIAGALVLAQVGFVRRRVRR
jgi:hypothetical protein